MSSESSVGLSSDYNSNPFLATSGAHSAESVAVQANLPATYTSDAQTIELTPRVRFAQTRGDQALLSNYQYLDGSWRINGERNSFTTRADWHHDSTLYNSFENAALFGRNLRRLEEIASLDWQHSLSERSDLHVSGSWDRVAYSQNAATGLVSFSYGQGSLQYDRALNERWQWTSAAGFGRYSQLDQSYRSTSRYLQTSLIRALSARWSMTAQVGYAYLSSSEQGNLCCQIVLGSGGYFLQLIPFNQSASRGSGNYLLSVERKSERMVLDLTGSRSIQPSGLGGLLTQDDVSLKASMPWTERLSVAAALHGARLADSLHQLNFGDRRYGDFDLSANWLWTEKWTLQLQGTYNLQRLSNGGPTASGVAVYLTLLRQFGRLRL